MLFILNVDREYYNYYDTITINDFKLLKKKNHRAYFELFFFLSFLCDFFLFFFFTFDWCFVLCRFSFKVCEFVLDESGSLSLLDEELEPLLLSELSEEEDCDELKKKVSS